MEILERALVAKQKKHEAQAAAQQKKHEARLAAQTKAVKAALASCARAIRHVTHANALRRTPDSVKAHTTSAKTCLRGVNDILSAM